jgi:hypothetical protein
MLTLQACDNDWNPLELPARVRGQFPSATATTLPAKMLGMVYSFDNGASQTSIWSEPTIAPEPKRGRRKAL